MISWKITSLQHPLIKKVVKLRKDKASRRVHKQVVIIGKKICHELAPLECLFTEEKASSLPKAKTTYVVSPQILKKISGHPSPEPFVGLLPLAEPQDLQEKNPVLLLDQIADPGNMGTLFRTALSFSFGGIYLSEGCVDLFHEKVIAASKGAVCKLPYQYIQQQELPSSRLYFVADAKGTPFRTCPFSKKVGLILGNEAHGARLDRYRSAKKISIPISNQMESLNVSIAGGILMHAISESLL